MALHQQQVGGEGVEIAQAKRARRVNRPYGRVGGGGSSIPFALSV